MPLRKLVFALLLTSTALVFPAWLLAAWFGFLPPWWAEPVPQARWVGFVILLSVLSAAVLTLLSLRDVRLSGQLSDAEKMKWREAIIVFSVFAALFYYFKRFCEETNKRQSQEG